MTDSKLDFWIQNNYNVLFIGKHGVGKCLGKGTPVIMYDGTTKLVENIIPGDVLMGPDSKKRTVETISTGTENMYKISPIRNGDSFVVNESHILSLKSTGNSYGYKHGETINISVREYLKLSKNRKKYLCGYRTGIDFESKIVNLDPYLLGLWLGDGSSERPLITTADQEIENYLKTYVSENGTLRVTERKKGKANQISIVSNENTHKVDQNFVRTQLRELNVLNNKHIPEAYLYNDRNTRLELLAGLIDSDGTNTYDYYVISTKFDILNENIKFLARSLGFGVNSRIATVKNKKYHIISITGDTWKIPVKIKRKKQIAKKKKRDSLKFGFSVENLGIGTYYGFTLVENPLFLLGDFTVTHNTSRILEAFKRNNLKWKYFSAATLDPWTDLVGVPREVKDANGNSYLDFVLPKDFMNDEVEAILFDEYNRSHAKVRNATMELLQFKSINGKKFKNLRFIWAAINPENELDEETGSSYDVETLDPAQKDRFEIQIEVPYKPDITYFKNKYGEDIGKTAVSWWNDLNDTEKNEVSPRRLDYAIDLYVKSGDLRDVLSKKINVTKLISELKNGNYREQMETIYKNRDLEKAASFIKDENNYNNTIKYILQDKNKLNFFFDYIPEEKQSNLVATDDTAMKHAFNNMDKYNVVVQRASIANTKIAKALAKWIRNKPMDVANFENFTFSSNKLKFVKPPRAMETSMYKNYSDMILHEMSESNRGTAYRRNAFKFIAWAIYNDKGYGSPNPKNPLTEEESVLTLNSLNSLIDSIYQFDNFKELPQVYGLVCSEYMRRYGKKQKYNELSRKVKEFLNLHGNLYI